jgi:glutamate-1-semialdehyde 2,1-aminomutase
MTAGLAMLKKLKRENPYERLALQAKNVASRIETLAKGAGVPLHVQSFASLFWMVLGEVKTKDGIVRSPEQTPSAQKEQYARIFHSLLNDGIYLAPSGYEVSFLSTVHTEELVARLVSSVGRAIRQ